jgi:hypothetical protein
MRTPAMSAASVTPARSAAAANSCSLTPLRTPGSTGSPDSSQLVERLQLLKSRLSNMTKTLEQSVAAASPLRGKANEQIIYSTPRLVAQVLEGAIGQDESLFLAPGQEPTDGAEVTEIRFTLAAASDEEIEALVGMLQLEDSPTGAVMAGYF